MIVLHTMPEYVTEGKYIGNFMYINVCFVQMELMSKMVSAIYESGRTNYTFGRASETLCEPPLLYCRRYNANTD